MSFINPISREQLMLPSSIEDYVSADHIVRFIERYLAQLNENDDIDIAQI